MIQSSKTIAAPPVMQVSLFADATFATLVAEFSTLADALAAAEAGNGLRINENASPPLGDQGPVTIDVNNLTIDADSPFDAAFALVSSVSSLTLLGNASINVTGSAIAQTINGNAGDNVLHDGGTNQADVLRGGLGNDTYKVYNAGDVIHEAVGQGTADKVLAAVDFRLGSGVYVEFLAAYSGSWTAALKLTGNPLAQDITGNGGNNVLHDGGTFKADVLRGLAGDDTYKVYNSGDVIIEVAFEGWNDKVVAAVDYKLADGVDVEFMETASPSGTTPIKLTGNSLRQYMTGNAGDNILADGGRTSTQFGDTLSGLAGNDVYRVEDTFTKIVEGADEGTADRVQVSRSYTLASEAHVEFLEMVNSAGKAYSRLTGNSFGQQITGDASDNILHDGGKGGSDILRGLAGKDDYHVNNSGDVIVESILDSDVDRVFAAVSYKLAEGVAVEQMVASTIVANMLTLSGNSYDQRLTGHPGDNVLMGYGGNDYLEGLLGKDVFGFNTALNAATNVDEIRDFTAVDDTIRLDDAVFQALATGTLAVTAFRANLTGAAADSTDRIIYQTDTGKLFYDADGLGGADGVHFATLLGQPAITNADFTVI